MLCHAQALSFEVVSVKLSPPGAEGRSVSQKPGDRLTTSNATVRMLLMLAYQMMPDQIYGGPNWLETDGFDIEAKTTGPSGSPAQFRERIQSLLAERFHITVHQETRELSVYQLVVAKSGFKAGGPAGDRTDIGVRVEGPGQITAVKGTMPMLAGALSRPLKARVVDATGLTGAYNFKLEFAPESKAADR